MACCCRGQPKLRAIAFEASMSRGAQRERPLGGTRRVRRMQRAALTIWAAARVNPLTGQPHG